MQDQEVIGSNVAAEQEVPLSELSRVRIVLVATSHPGNIGAAARAMKTMGLTQLTLVQPVRYPSDEATARAAGAADVLAAAEVTESLAEALQGCSVCYGTTARPRKLSATLATPRQCAEQALQQLKTHADGDIALVFGRESSGLTNAELDLCQRFLRVPANPEYSSLNLAMAVQLLSYELRMAALTDEPLSEALAEGQDSIGAEEMEHLYDHLQRVLIRVQFLNPEQPRYLMRRLRQLFNRARLDRNELNLLRGILAAIEKRVRE